METFTARVQRIDRERLRAYLQTLQSPCYESQLLRIVFPELEIAQASPLVLYQHHFLLFHVLYQLQDQFYKENQYLYVHFMRTMLLPYPNPGQCRFFNEDLVSFCQTACLSGSAYCLFHAKQLGDTALDELSLKYFYADARNFERFDEDTAAAFIEGTWEILAHYEKYQQCFQILDIPETTDLISIKKTFKRLAKQYHPDRGAGSHEKFVEINNAYQFLLHVVPGMKTQK